MSTHNLRTASVFFFDDIRVLFAGPIDDEEHALNFLESMDEGIIKQTEDLEKFWEDVNDDDEKIRTGLVFIMPYGMFMFFCPWDMGQEDLMHVFVHTVTKMIEEVEQATAYTPSEVYLN